MQDSWVRRDVTWNIKDIGAFLVDSIAGALYSREEVFREYVQNAVDSYADFQRITGRTPENTVQAWTDLDSGALHIRDNGIGMDWTDINIAKAIAVSPKNARPDDFVGFRGIGIWAGLSACDQIVITTTKVGVGSSYRLTIDCRGIMENRMAPISIDELLQGRFYIEEAPCDPDSHFTQVKLVRVHTDSHPQLLSETELTRYAEQHLPVPFDPAWTYATDVCRFLESTEWTKNFDLSINGKPVYRRFPSSDDIKPPERHVIVDGNRPIAVAWLCETARRGAAKVLDPDSSKGPVRNFAVRVRNFTVGDRGLYSNSSIQDVNYLNWFVGEIYITDSEIQPDTKRTHFQGSDRSHTAVTAIQSFYGRVTPRARGWSQQLVTEEACARITEEAALFDAVLGDPNLDHTDKAQRLREILERVEGHNREIEASIKEAKRTDGSAVKAIVREYLKKPQVRDALSSAAHTVDDVRARARDLDENILVPVSNGRRKPAARARRRQSKNTRTKNGTGQPYIDPATVFEAVSAAVAFVVGDQSEQHRRIMSRLPEELVLRGVRLGESIGA